MPGAAKTRGKFGEEHTHVVMKGDGLGHPLETRLEQLRARAMLPTLDEQCSLEALRPRAPELHGMPGGEVGRQSHVVVDGREITDTERETASAASARGTPPAGSGSGAVRAARTAVGGAMLAPTPARVRHFESLPWPRATSVLGANATGRRLQCIRRRSGTRGLAARTPSPAPRHARPTPVRSPLAGRA